MTIQSTNFQLPNQQSRYQGKVRDVYDCGEVIVMVASDRISCFDVVLPRQIPYKGAVLNQLAAYFLRATSDIVPNWLRSVPDPNASMGVKADPVKVEVVVRGMLVGSAWRAYKSGVRVVCGVALPDGLQEFSRFEQPIITPTTKADAGHDEDISEEEILASGRATLDEWQQITGYAQALFAKGQAMAAERGLILADTKYEFGRLSDGSIILMDEIHTPDSSRYYYQTGYDVYMNDPTTERPQQLSKEFVREWLLAQGFSGKAGQTPPEMSDVLVTQISERYIELYELLTGKAFERPERTGEHERIQQAIIDELEKQ